MLNVRVFWLEQVTKRVDSKDDGEWSNWNWRTEGDLMENGAFFVASGGGVSALFSKASSVEPKASALVDQLTRNAGVFGGPRYLFLLYFLCTKHFFKLMHDLMLVYN